MYRLGQQMIMTEVQERERERLLFSYLVTRKRFLLPRAFHLPNRIDVWNVSFSISITFTTIGSNGKRL